MIDFSLFDKLDASIDKLEKAFQRGEDNNRLLLKRIFSLESGLPSQQKDSDEARIKHKNLIEERDRLVMSNELVRQKVSRLLDRVDEAIEVSEGKTDK